MRIVYLRSVDEPEGVFLPESEARITPTDRGFMFGDGIYEVIRSYRGRLFKVREHLARFAHSLSAVRIPYRESEELLLVAEELIQRNRLLEVDAAVYLQVTRGAALRQLQFPSQVVPTVYAETVPIPGTTGVGDQGVSAIVVPDIRWGRCDIKAVGLLPNVLAQQQAFESGAAEAIFVRDGMVTEGTHTSVFGVLDGTVLTHPADHMILAGITRGVVIELCRLLNIQIVERAIEAGELARLDELFLTCTTGEIIPVVTLSDCPVGSGSVGQITRRLQSAFRDCVVADS